MNKRKIVGFTLIEIMIVVAIIGILAAIALPSYRESVLKSRRSEARAALTQGAQNFERWFTQNNSYSSATGILPTSTAYYTYAIDATTSASTFLLTATPIGAQANDKCGKFEINQVNVKSVTVPLGSTLTATDCWPN